VKQKYDGRTKSVISVLMAITNEQSEPVV